MKSILEELYDGNIYPDELIISKDPVYRPLNKRISDMLIMWKKKLSEDDYNCIFHRFFLSAFFISSVNDLRASKITCIASKEYS